MSSAGVLEDCVAGASTMIGAVCSKRSASKAYALFVYAETSEWMPEIDERTIFTFDQIPQLAEDYEAEATDYFPCFSINPE
jgi:hypothetical protein